MLKWAECGKQACVCKEGKLSPVNTEDLQWPLHGFILNSMEQDAAMCLLSWGVLIKWVFVREHTQKCMNVSYNHVHVCSSACSSHPFVLLSYQAPDNLCSYSYYFVPCGICKTYASDHVPLGLEAAEGPADTSLLEYEPINPAKAV